MRIFGLNLTSRGKSHAPPVKATRLPEFAPARPGAVPGWENGDAPDPIRAPSGMNKNSAKVPEKTPAGLVDDENKSSDLSPADTDEQPEDAAEWETGWVKYVQMRFEAAKSSPKRQSMERDVLASLPMTLSPQCQWFSYSPSSAGGGYEDQRGAADDFLYVVDDQTSPILDRRASLMTQSLPDADVSPETAAPLDQAAAREAAGVLRRWESDFGLQDHMKTVVSLADRTSTVYNYVWWNKDKEVLVPVMGPDGSIEKVVSSKAGGVEIETVPWHSAFPYADVEDANTPRGILFVRPISRADLHEKYGNKADGVGSEDAETLSPFMTRAAWMGGDLGYTAERSNKGAYADTLLETHLLEIASPRYPDGVHLVVAGGRVLYAGGLQTKDKKRLPVAAFQIEKVHGTPWGLNIVSRMAPHQRGINRMWKRILDILDAYKVSVVVQEGVELDPDAYRKGTVAGTRFDTAEFYDRIYVARGTQHMPEFQTPPALPQEFITANEMMLDRMKAISGIRDAVSGQAPSSDSGIKVQLLQDAAKAQLALATGYEETFVERLSELVVTLTAENASHTLLWGASENADPAQAAQEAGALKAMSAGGRVRIRVTPGSAIPKFPEAFTERLDKLQAAGAFAPEQLPATIARLKSETGETTSKLATDLEQAFEKMQADAKAAQPDPAALEQQKQQAAQAQAQAEQQHAAELQAATDHHAQTVAQLKQAHDAQMAAIEHHNDMEASAQKHTQDMEMTRLKASLPSLSLAGKMGAEAVVNAEKEVGIEDDIGGVKKANEPAPPNKTPAES